MVRDAYVNLLPSDQFEERETTNDQVDQSQKRRKGKKRDDYHEYDDSLEFNKEPETEDGGEANPYDTIVLPVETRPLPPGRQTRGKTNPGSRRYWETDRSKKNHGQPDTTA